MKLPQGRMSNNMKATISPTDLAAPFGLSPTSYRLLCLLQRGSAYSVRGRWRFRGLRASVSNHAFVSLLSRGLAERVETDRFALVRITPAGRSIGASNGPLSQSDPQLRRLGARNQSTSRPLPKSPNARSASQVAAKTQEFTLPDTGQTTSIS